MQNRKNLQQSRLHNLKDSCNYISNKISSYKAIQNTIIYFEALYWKQLICIQMHVMNGQMKILKKIRVDPVGITFMNKGNQFIKSDFQSLSLWKNDTFQNWHYYKTIFQGKISQNIGSYLDICQTFGLNNQDDLIAASDYKRTFFIKLDNQGNWVCNQIVQTDLDLLIKYKFNEQSDVLLANVKFESKLVIFKKNGKKEKWEITQIISISQQNRQYESFCFIGDYKFIYLSINSGFITQWEINSEATAREVKETKFQVLEKKKRFENIKFVKSKDLLLTLSFNDLYLIKVTLDNFQIEQMASITSDFQTASCNNQEFLFIQQSNRILRHISKIFVKRIY